MQEDFKIIALVKFNDGVAMVLNRLPEFVYDHIGDTPHLIGSDGILKNAYKHETPKGSFKGFAGRSFFIPMRDGTTKHAAGQYWSCGLDGHVEIAFSSIDELKKCYVYRSALVKKEDLEKVMVEYTGCIYPYREYQKIIKYDDERRYWINKLYNLENKANRAKANLIRNVKEVSARLKDVKPADVAAVRRQTFEEALQAIKSIPTPMYVETINGHEDAYRAVEALSAEPAQGEQSGITISSLQAAHIERQKEWCPDQQPDLSFRGNEMAGEVGEACNVIKKLERERQGWRGSRSTKEELASELADVIHTAILCAVTAGIDLEAATVEKFNATSDKNDLRTRLTSVSTTEAGK